MKGKKMIFQRKYPASLLLIFIGALLSQTFSVSSQQCVMPQNSMQVGGNVVICPGEFALDEGILFSEDNSVLDCENASIKGKGTGYGILSMSRNNITIRNCIISNFEVGIYLENTGFSKVRENIITDNKFGIVLSGSPDNIVESNIFGRNSRKDTFEYDGFSENFSTTESRDTSMTPLQIFQSEIKIRNPGISDLEVALQIDSAFNRYFNRTQEYLRIERIYRFNESEGSTTIILRLIPSRVLLNLSVYEEIPKCMSDLAASIIFHESNYEILQNDPIILWKFPRLEREARISYKIKGSINEECKSLLAGFGIAKDFLEEDTKAQEDRHEYPRILVPVMLIVLLASLAIFLRKYSKT